MDTTSSSSSSSKKLKHIQVLPYNIMEIDENEDPAEVFIIGEKVSTSKILKATKMVHDNNGINQVKDLMDPTSAADPEFMNDPLEIFEQGSENFGILDDDSWDYDYDEESYYDDVFSYDDTLNLQAQFDYVNLPPGVEAAVPWFDHQKKPVSTSISTAPSQSNYSVIMDKDEVEILSQLPAKSQRKLASTSRSCQGSNSEEEDPVLKKFRMFKRFDTVQDFSDHHYSRGDFNSKQATRNWTKTIQQEWRILEKDLPDTIFVRVYEERMDLLRAVIIGAAGTPYHDGLFFFDVLFPSDYPKVPPQVHYHSGGLRLNPNLYNCGKVCLSLLNTWPGKPSEQWTPGKSTMLQVLLSIQALVLNAKPFFNEPGFERMAGEKLGEKKAQDYNENAFILSCKTMLYTLRRPPKHFEDFVVGHFREHAHAILVACRAYIEGAQVGCLVGGIQDVDEGEKSSSKNFKRAVGGIVAGLVPSFIKNGAKDCEQFIPLGDINRSTPLKIRD